MTQTSVILQDLLTSLTHALQDRTTLVLDETTLEPTSAKPLWDLFSQLEIHSFTLRDVQLPFSFTDTDLVVTGHDDNGVWLDLTFEEVLGEVAIEALFHAPAPAALTDAFRSLPAGFFDAIKPSDTTASITVPGLAELTLASPRYGVVGLMIPASGLVTTSIAPRVDGQASLPGGPRGLLVEVQTATSGYRVAPLAAAWTFEDLGQLMPRLGLLTAVQGIIQAKNVGLQGFDLNLYPDVPEFSSISLDVADTADAGKALWSAVGGKVELTDVILTLDLTYADDGSLALADTGSVQGNFSLDDHLTLNAQIPWPPTGIWSLTAYPNVTLSVLDQIAKLLPDGVQPLSELLPAQLGGIGRFEFTYIRVAVDVGTFSLAEFTVALASDKSWQLVPPPGHGDPVIELASLQMSLTIDGTPSVTGTVTGILQLPEVADIIVSFGRSTAQQPWRLDVISPAVALPSIGHLAQLAQGEDLGSMIKAGGLDQVRTGFVMTNLNLGIALSPAKLTNLGFTLHLADAGDPLTPALDWKITELLTLTQFSFGFQIGWGDTVAKDVFGTFVLNGLEFDVRFASQATAGASIAGLIGEYSAGGASGTVNVHDLINSIASTVAADLPDVEIDLADAVLAYLETDSTAKFLFAMDIAAEFPISGLPLVGAVLPADATLAVRDLKVVVASAALSAQDVEFINGMSAKPVLAPSVAGGGIPAGLAFIADLQLGADHESISVAVPAPAAKPADPAAATAAAAAPAAGHWFDVGKSIGPVSIARIGMQYQDGRLFLLVDASLGLAGLSVGLDGLGLGSPLTRFAPVAHLDGLSVSFSDPPVSISGGFLAVTAPPAGVTDEYAGELMITVKAFMISGVGAYAKVGGNPSFFVFAEVDGEIGGPPAFFVTGLMGGIGYNWALSLPPADQVYQFPFVSGLGNPAFFGSTRPTPVQVLGALSGTDGQTGWVTPSPGRSWLAAGVQFRSFELITGRALLVAEFGAGFELALLGLATIVLPQGATGDAYAYAELQLEVVVKPDDGVFSAIASLTPGSYLLTRQCQLTGGFAFCLWFGPNPHAGDFVLTLGGYHPAFAPPSWYPSVPPVGVHWAVDDNLVIKGTAYFAVTPTAAMAGGSLEVVFESGDLRAWLTAHADIMIRWQPFYLTAHVAISVGVSYRLNLGFTSTVLAVELGATLDLWGPPTGGVVHVDWYIISFSISFGADPASKQELTLDWPGFQALLPSAGHPAQAASLAGGPARVADEPHPAIVTLSVSRGLRSTDGVTGDWIVRSDELVLRAASAVPMTSVSFGRPVPLPGGAPDTIDIRPMGASQVTSAFVITVSGVDVPGVDLTTWPAPSVQSSALPEALWGTPIADTDAPAPAAELIRGLPTGVVFAPPPTAAGAAVGPFDPGSLISPVGQGVLPLRPASQADPIAGPVADAGSIQAIAADVDSDASVVAQAQLVSLLASYGAAPPTNAPLTQLGQQAGAVFAQPPMRGGLR